MYKIDIKTGEHIASGTNATVWSINGETSAGFVSGVLKIYGTYRISYKLYKIFSKSVESTFNILAQRDILVPHHYFSGRFPSVYFENHNIKDEDLSFFIFESYCGESIRDLIRRNNGVLDKEIYSKTVKVIEALPTNIPLDTNPGNFTVLNGRVYFVDAVPNIYWIQNLEPYERFHIFNLFPSLMNVYLDTNLVERYFGIAGRVERFNYYVSKISSESYLG
jgi:hypothetical protein